MDRLLAPLCFWLALLCGAMAVLLLLAAFVEFLGAGRWPDQSVLRLLYDSGALRARVFLVHHWAMPVRNALAWLSTPLVLLAVAPALWWLRGRLAQ